MVPFHQTYASWIAEIAPVVAQRDVVYDLGTFCFLILLLYLFETISFRFVCAGGLGHKLLRYLLAPGVLIHEIGHFCVALHLEFLHELSEVRRRFAERGPEALSRAVAELRCGSAVG